MKKDKTFKKTVEVRLKEIDTLKVDVETELYYPEYILKDNWFYLVKKHYSKNPFRLFLRFLFKRLFNRSLVLKVKSKTYSPVSTSAATELYRICQEYMKALLKVIKIEGDVTE